MAETATAASPPVDEHSLSGKGRGVIWLNAWRDPVANLKAFNARINNMPHSQTPHHHSPFIFTQQFIHLHSNTSSTHTHYLLITHIYERQIIKYHRPTISIDTTDVDLADLNGDGDHKLVVADLDKKLKIFKGTSLVMEHVLLDTPVAVCCYYMDPGPHSTTPVMAVAAGSHIYIYKSMKPFFKFTLPNPQIEPQELEVWNDLKADRIDCARAKDILRGIKDRGIILTPRSQDLLVVHDSALLQEFVSTYKSQPLMQQAVITCMNTIKKSKDEPTALSCLIVGTESGQVMYLDPSAATVVKKVTLKSPPAFIVSHGLFDVEYRTTVACRNGNLYSIKNGDITGTVIELEVQPVGLERIGKHIFVACMDNCVHAFQLRGKKDFTLYMPSGITNMEMLRSETTNAKGLVIALDTGEVRIYHEKNFVSNFIMPNPITALKFGHFGREGGTLIMVTNTGALEVKILSRTSTPLNTAPPINGPPPEQEIPLKVPKKTRLNLLALFRVAFVL